MVVTKQDLKEAIARLGLEDNIVCLHSSLSSFGCVEDGASTVVEAFLEKRCTLVVPTFEFSAQVPAPPGRVVLRNGGAEGELTRRDRQPAKPFDREGNDISPGMGAIPQAVLNHPQRLRGNHPLNSLSAVGPRAEEIICAQEPLNVYGPYRRVYEIGGYLLLMGVDLTKATPIHFAEELAGRNLFRRWALVNQDQVQEVHIGSCSEAFERLAEVVEDIEQKVLVGKSLWRAFPFKEFIDRTTDAIRSNPSITHCGRPDCPRCDDAVAGGPIV